jgi:hypothetical protein
MKKEGLSSETSTATSYPATKGAHRIPSVTDKLHFHPLTVPYRPSTPSNPTVAEHQWNFPRSFSQGEAPLLHHLLSPGLPKRYSLPYNSPPKPQHQSSNQENVILLPHRERRQELGSGCGESGRCDYPIVMVERCEDVTWWVDYPIDIFSVAV